MPAPPDWSPPKAFDEYEILHSLGAGGMGQVWVAQDTLLERAVAIKFIATEPGPEERQRFLVEARAAARLQHPNVVTVHRVGEIDGRPYLVSELVRGQSLAEVPRPVPWPRALELALGLVRGLAAAHRSGVLHRDIKPGNAVIADDGTVKLLDFGIAKLVGATSVHTRSAAGERAEPHRPVDPTGELGTVRAALSDVPASAATPRPDLTATGTVLGTPRYMAPELWRGEPASRASDLYSLGVLVWELCAGETPFASVPITRLAAWVQDEDARHLRTVAADTDPAFAGIVDRCLARDPAARPRSADELLDALEQLTPLARGAERPEGNPYRGLAAFEAEHRALFFGRTGEIRIVLERLRTDPFVLLAGDSGVGKSSICRAGVLPRVADGVLGGAWSIARLLPGRHPAAALASAIADALGTGEEPIARALEAGGAQVGRTLRQLLGPERGLLVFVDQMEELLTLATREEVALAGEALGRLASGLPRLKVLGTVRGDFLTRLASVPGIGYEVTRALYIVRRLGPDRIREVVEGPAAATGIRFESEALVDRLVHSAAASGEGALPLLQFALAELWETHDPTSRTITAAGLEALGGVEGALARHGDAALARLSAEDQAGARRVLVALVGREGTRDRRAEADLVRGDAAARRAIDALVRARLLVARQADDVASVELAHEALVAGWATLRGWLREDEGQHAGRLRLEAAATEWERLGRTGDTLWTERQIAEVGTLPPESLAPGARAFLDASRAVVRARRRRRIFVAAAGLLGAVLLWGGVRLDADRAVSARLERRVAQADGLRRRARALDRRAEELRGRALARFDAGELERAEGEWTAVLALEERVSLLQERAGDALEAAILIDARAPGPRRRLADLLYDRVGFARRTGRERPEAIAGRLSLYDAGGARRRRLSAPARVRIATSPAGARVWLAPIDVRPDGARLVGDARDLGRSPIEESAKEPGSWLLRVEAPGRARVVVPVLLGNGERVAMQVPLPRAEVVPAGLVPIPPGRFLFGSDDAGLRREFFHTVPQHSVATGGYLIARRETTFGEWIAWLETLGPGELEARSPRAGGSGGIAGSVSLERGPDGRWRLAMRPGSQSLAAAAGEPLRIPGRGSRGVVEWERLPVVGIAFEDAEAYATWLARTGRIPGARLCDEREWERAARGADGRQYPHGDRLLPGDANFDRTYGRDQTAVGPDPVGSRPGSQSPFGVDDLAGNVWEWTRSAFRPGAPVVRGGAFYFDEKTARSANREEVDPTLRDVSVGFRICADWF